MANYSRAHICQCLSHISTRKRSSMVTVAGDRRKTGQQFVDSVYSLARGLVKLGIRNGDVVAISAFNSDWYLEWILAVAFVGGILAPLNYRWSFKEARLAMLSIRPVLLVTDKSCSYWYSELQNDAKILSLRWHVSLDSPSSDFASLFDASIDERSPFLEYSWAPDGAVIICFTSGTTGRPKGVVISHEALIVQSLAKIAIIGYSEDDVYLHTAPLCHIGGLSSAIAMLMIGACHVLIPKFEAKSTLEAIEQHCVTSLITVPAMMADLISLIREKELAWKGRYCLRKILNGGGGLSKMLIQEAINIFPKAKLVSAYGMTETTSSLTFTTLYSPIENSSELVPPRHKLSQPQGVCVGKPAPHVEIKIHFDGSDQAGRILTRGPHVMLRYWDQVKTESGHDFWLDTGDFGSIDKYGNVWLVGRTNFRIKSGGENVYPEEVEAVLSQCPGVASIVVVSISDLRLTEMVIACVQLRENWQWSDNKHVRSKENLLCGENLRDFCREKNLTGFKIPKKFILWMKPFPTTTTGKIRRDEVRSEVTSYMQLLSSNL